MIRVMLCYLISLSLLSCKSPQNRTSDVHVSNGIDIDERKYPEVVSLIITDHQKQQNLCSGTFVTPTMLITAAHCVIDSTSQAMLEDIKVQDQFGSFHKGEPFPWSEFDGTLSSLEIAENDLAIVKFQEPIAPDIAKLAPKAPDIGETITFVGFGTNDAGKLGVKRQGSNGIVGKEGNLISVEETSSLGEKGQNSIALRGDSGGAVFNKKKELVAVISVKTRSRDKRRGNFFVDINQPGPKRFFEDTTGVICNRRGGCFGCFGLSPLTRWVVELTTQGMETLQETASNALKAGPKMSKSGSFFSVNWVDEVMGNHRAISIQSEYLDSFDVADAMDHYFHHLGRQGFFLDLEKANIPPGDYIRQTFVKTMDELERPGRCGGANCRNIYRFPEDIDGDQYLERLRHGPLSDPEITEQLPKSLRPIKGVGQEKSLDEIFQCLP